MRCIIFILIFALGSVARASGIPVLVYHDIQPGPVSDSFTVSLKEFKRQMAFLDRKGYQVISLKRLEHIARTNEALPAKVVILTFDDGLKSYRQYVLPVLQQYRFPSVLSIVTSWVDGDKIPKEYKNKIMDWDTIKKIDSNSLVEVISHSHALHSGTLSNPQGNQKALAIVRAYDPAKKRYETEAHFQRRIERDLSHTRARFVAKLGHAPFAITWPYGHYEQYHIEAAKKYGIRLHLTLDEGPAYVSNLPTINRVLMRNKKDSALFSDILSFRHFHNKQLRFTEINLKSFVGLSAKKQNILLSGLIRRNELLGINAIVVHPFDRYGVSAFFSTKQMSVTANILDRVLHQMLVRNDVKLYLRIPLSLKTYAREALIKQLARLHFFQGVIFYGRDEVSGFQRFSKIVRFYRPDAKIGYEGTDKSITGMDFRYVRLSPDKKPDFKSIKKKGIRQYVVIDSTSSTKEKAIIRMIRTLRRHGIRDIGYAGDNYMANKPDVMGIAPELRRSSNWKPGEI